jgi:hypothetical protein
MIDRTKSHLSAVLEPDGFAPSRARLPARGAFHLNANPLELMARYEPDEWASVLREIERHQHGLEAQRAPDQAEWAGASARRNNIGSGRAAELIVGLLDNGGTIKSR